MNGIKYPGEEEKVDNSEEKIELISGNLALIKAKFAEYELEISKWEGEESALEVNQAHGFGQEFHQLPVALFAGSKRRRGVPQTQDSSNSRQKFICLQWLDQVIICVGTQAVPFQMANEP